MKVITAGQVHKALVDSIEKRWIPIAKGESEFDVPECQLCKITHTTCEICPLGMIGDRCIDNSSFGFVRGNSTFGKFRYAPLYNKKRAANNMIKQLQKCLDTFFPAGLEK